MTKTETLEVALDDVQVKTNHRAFFDKDRMQELAENIKTFGVLEPLLVRRVDDELHLIAGARRLRAAKMAGLSMVPVRVLDVDAATAAEIQLLENLQRQGLGPVEEAQAFKTLLENGKHTPESLAERVDKSVAYVYRALRLMDLPKAALTAIEQGVLTPAHGHQLLRVPEDQREKIVDWVFEQQKMHGGFFTVAQLRARIDYDHGADLGNAIFPKGKAYAGEPACTGCQFNSGNQGNLFDGAEKGRCNNVPCFQKKTGTFLEDYSKAQAAEHGGLQYLGIRTVEMTGEIEGLRRAVIVPVEPKKKLLTDAPEKFGWIVVSPRHPGDKPTTAVVCLDKRILEPRETHRRGTAPGRSSSQDREEERRGGAPTPEELFIESKVEDAFKDAIEATVMPRKRFDFTTEQWCAIFGGPVLGPSDRANAQTILMQAVMNSADPEKGMKDLGLKPDKIRAAATKQAQAEWEKRGAGK